MTPVLQHQHFMLGLILSLLLRNLVVAQAQQGGWTPAGVLVVDPTGSDQSGIGSNRWKLTPSSTEKNFVRLLIFFRSLFSAESSNLK
jgi:hypothetical protein